MYIFTKKNPSGSYTIALFKSIRKDGKKSPTSVLIKNFGTTKDSLEIKKLQKKALLFKQEMIKQNPKAKSILLRTGSDIISSKIIQNGFHDIYGTVFDQLQKEFSLKGKAKIELLRNLCVLRIARPASKHNTASFSHEYGCQFKVDSAYKLMDKIDDKIIESIKKSIFNRSKRMSKNKSIDVVFYDLATIYFETNTKDDLRQFGFSKDGKSQHVQITLALMVTNEGLPLGYEIFPGNMYEGHTLKNAMEKLQEFYKIKKVVIVADSGLLSKANLQLIESMGYKYIIAARIKSMKKSIIERVISKDGYEALSNNIFYKILDYENSQKLICYFSEKKKRKDEHDRENKISKILNGQNAKTALSSKYKYIKLDKSSKIRIDEEELEFEKSFDGYFGSITNCQDLTADEIMCQYKGLWQVERSFRIIIKSIYSSCISLERI